MPTFRVATRSALQRNYSGSDRPKQVRRTEHSLRRWHKRVPLTGVGVDEFVARNRSNNQSAICLFVRDMLDNSTFGSLHGFESMLSVQSCRNSGFSPTA